MDLEVRKHCSQMTTDEKLFLNSFLTKDKNDYKMSRHATEREKQKIISKDCMYRAIHNGNIIEYHFKNSNRLLVRGNVDENGYNVCVVVNCDTREIITAYMNSVSDNHCTLKEELYEKDFDIASMFKNNTYKNNNTKLN